MCTTTTGTGRFFCLCMCTTTLNWGKCEVGSHFKVGCITSQFLGVVGLMKPNLGPHVAEMRR